MVGLTMASQCSLASLLGYNPFKAGHRWRADSEHIQIVYYIVYYIFYRYTLLLLLFVTGVVVGITWNYYTVFIVCYSYNCYYWVVKLLLLFGVIIIVVVIMCIYIHIYIYTYMLVMLDSLMAGSKLMTVLICVRVITHWLILWCLDAHHSETGAHLRPAHHGGVVLWLHCLHFTPYPHVLDRYIIFCTHQHTPTQHVYTVIRLSTDTVTDYMYATTYHLYSYIYIFCIYPIYAQLLLYGR